MTARLSDWEERLHAYLDQVAALPFSWGKHDCLMFVAGAIKAVTGRDPARGHRGKYSGGAGALRYMARRGWNDVAVALCAHLEECAPAFARRGDIVLFGDIAGVCMGATSLFVSETGEGAGLSHIDTSQISRAWRNG